MEIFPLISDYIDYILDYMGIYAPFLSCLLIILESIFPVLPLFIFIAINFIIFGSFMGFFISWAFTIIGCMLAFFVIRKGLHKYFLRVTKKIEMLNKSYNYVNKLNIQQLTILMAIPFTPAFALNVIAGLSDIPAKNYFISLLVGKVFMVYFWGFVGTNLIESLTNPIILIKIFIMILFAYLISNLLSKIFIKNAK